MRLLDGKVAWVTGAAAGIGEAIALGFAEQGAGVVALDRNAAGSRDIAARICGAGGQALGLEADVRDGAALESALGKTLEHFGRIDILVNNAGMYPRRRFLEMTEQEWDDILAVNLKGAFQCARLVVPHMVRQGGGKVINISSVTFFFGKEQLTHYVSAKGGLIGFTRSLAREMGPQGIYVNCVSPGAIKTESEKNFATEEQARALVDVQSVKRRILPVDVANVCLFLASSLSDGMTGQTLNVDGGWITY